VLSVEALVRSGRSRRLLLGPGATALDSGVGFDIVAASLHERRRVDSERVIAIVANRSSAVET
jgi:hypothetical protein